MKHLFLVHSPVAYLVSVSVINELKIDKEDAVIIFNEFAKIPSGSYTGISINEFYKSKGLKKLFNTLRYFSIPQRIDRLVEHITGEEKFIAYIPVLHLLTKSLITHPNCYSFSFIEEGLTNYYKEETLQSLAMINSKDSWRSSFLKNTRRVLNEMYLVLRGYNFKLQTLPFSYSCYNAFTDVGFYCLSDQSFPLINQNKKVILPFEQKFFTSLKQQFDFDLSNKIVWIGDASVKQRGFSESIYMEGIQEGCANFIKEKNQKEIFIKFHRDETKSMRKQIQKLFLDNDISFQVIPDSVIMELLLFKSKNVTLVGVYSSLLYYASIMGHHSFSIYEFLKKEYSEALKNRDFNFYWNEVELIKPAINISQD